MLLCCFPHVFCTWNSLTSWICGIIVHHTANISASISSNLFFLSLPAFFFFLNSSYTCDSPLEVVLQLTNDTFTFFIVFTHCFILGRFYCCVFKSTNLFLLKSLLCFQSKQACFMSDIVIFISRSSIYFLVSFMSLYLTCLLFHHLSWNVEL